ncbi:MAG: ATP-grasp domain-containing protein [Sporichthyaceae bacterium]
MTYASNPHVLVVAEPRYAAQLQPAGLVRALEGLGVPVRYRFVDGPSDASLREDLAWSHVVAARGRSEDLLAFLDLAAAHGRPVLDGADPIRSVRDKARMAWALLGARVPTPNTWIGPIADLVADLPSAAFPLILKPVFGDNAQGLLVVEDRETLGGTPWPENPALAQSYLRNHGADTKVYAIGETLTAITKPSPFTPGPDFAAQQVPLTPALAALARRCGQIFGLTMFGVDCLLTADGPLVIEVNDFPNFTGVPGADAALAAHVLAAASVRSLEGIGS